MLNTRYTGIPQMVPHLACMFATHLPARQGRGSDEHDKVRDFGRGVSADSEAALAEFWLWIRQLGLRSGTCPTLPVVTRTRWLVFTPTRSLWLPCTKSRMALRYRISMSVVTAALTKSGLRRPGSSTRGGRLDATGTKSAPGRDTDTVHKRLSGSSCFKRKACPTRQSPVARRWQRSLRELHRRNARLPCT